MRTMRFVLAVCLLVGASELVAVAGWTLGSPADNTDLHKTKNISSGGMTDQPSTDFFVYLMHNGQEYDREEGTSAAMGMMWGHLHIVDEEKGESHDCPVADVILFCLEVDELQVTTNIVNMKP